MKLKDLLWILAAFTVWRIALFVFSYLGVIIFEHQALFLAGGLEEYLQNPLFWGWGNFDGEHYLSIAQNGYRPLLYFYFPLYPLLISIFAKSTLLSSLLQTALITSHASFFVGLIGFWKLLSLDFHKGTIKTIIISLLVFPTSFYFAAAYTESLFFAIVVWSVYFARVKRWSYSGIVGAFSSAARIIGISLIPALLIESYYLSAKRVRITAIFIGFIAFGLIAYIYYLWLHTGNPLEFNYGSELFGEYRSQSPLFLPQIYYRYIFKIVPNLTWSYFPATFTTFLELFSGMLLTLAVAVGFFRLRISYWIYLVAGFVMPSMYNGFVSLPRYSLVLFPLFIFLGILLQRKNKYLKAIYYLISIVCLLFATALFTRGYWIS